MKAKIKKVSKFRPGVDRVHYGGAFIGEAEIKSLLDSVTENGGFTWTIGKRGTQLEKELAVLAGHKSAVLTNSGSSALLLALLGLDLPKGSAVALPATCFPTALSAIKYAGHDPVIVDSDVPTFNMSYNSLVSLLYGFEKGKRKLAAVVLVAIAGNVPDMEAYRKLARKHGFKLILDNCDGFGGTFKGKPIESYADIACTSFHAAHIISMGEGGAVFTSDSSVERRVRQYRDWGREDGSDLPTTIEALPAGYPRRYSYPVLGFNLKPLELQAAVGLVQLKKLSKFKKMRAQNYKRLREIFSKYPSCFINVGVVTGAEPCWFSFPLLVLTPERKEGVREFSKFLESKNIETRPIFAGNIKKHTIGKNLYSMKDLQGADDILNYGMFIGLSPRTTPEMLDWIEKCVDEYVEKIYA